MRVNPGVVHGDWLFPEVTEMVLGTKPQRGNKAEALEALKAAGHFLIDLSIEPVTDRKDLPTLVPDLVQRAKADLPDAARQLTRCAGRRQ